MDRYGNQNADAQVRPAWLLTASAAKSALLSTAVAPFTNKPRKEAEENTEQYVDSVSSYPPYLGAEHPAHRRSQGPLVPNPSLSATISYHGPSQQSPYGLPVSSHPQYQGTGPEGHSTQFPLGAATGPQNNWPDPLYGPDVPSDLYGHTGDGSVPTGHNLHTRGLPFQGHLIDSQDPRQQGLRNEPYQPESRRPTITQRSQDAIAYGMLPYPSSNPNYASHHQDRTRGSINDLSQGHYAAPNQAIQPLADTRNLAQQRPGQYQRSNFPGLDTGSMQAPPQAQYFQPNYGLSRPSAGSSFTPGPSGEMESPQASREAIRQSNSRNRQADPPRGPSPVASSTLPRSRIADRSDRSKSPEAPATPATSEGSNDPEQDEEEPNASASSSTSPTATTSTSTLTTVRWARFNVPDDVFLNPADPVRHQLYHQIRQEPWFINQTQERSITGDEASRILGSLPGESVLLAFYDRVPDPQSNRMVMRCTICVQTKQHAHLYPRTDRARVHMRHHFELRPIPCNGRCTVRHCRQRFFTTSDLNAHVTGKTEPLVACKYCKKQLRSKNLQRHVDYFCHLTPPGVRRERQGQGPVFDVPQTMSAPLLLLASSLAFLGQQSQTPLVINEKKTTDIHLGGRIIRLVMYGRKSPEDIHRAWIHRQTKISNVIEELSAAHQIDATDSVVVLEADWGPQPCWNEADPDSFIGEACQVLYVVFKTQFVRYILGVVRNSLTDFPLCISIPANASSKTISEWIMASRPELSGRIRSITGYTSDKDLGDAKIESPQIEALSSSKFRTAIIITLERHKSNAQRRMRGSHCVAPFSPRQIHGKSLISYPQRAGTHYHQIELSYKPIPALLQVPFLYCEHLMQRAYALDIFALQMIHITGATRHLIISLANEMKAVFVNKPPGIDTVLAAKGDLADLLQVAPLLSHELKTMLDRISRVIDQLEEDSFSREEAQKEIDTIFTALCGDFPGAVTVRHSYTLFKRLGSIDHQENQLLDRNDATSPEMIQQNVSDEHANTSGSLYAQDADHEMVVSESVGGSPATRHLTTHRGESDEDMVDLGGSERGSDRA